jgi:biofilm PGA synthesis N-glycosyltransferase PgaC
MMFDEITITVWIGITILTVVGLIQIIYTWLVFSKFAFYKPTSFQSDKEVPVSIIIAARNESKNLQQNLPAILEQDYPHFEVVVVNDCSWDDSKAILEEMQLQYKHLKVSNLIEQEKYPTGKKFALTIGIKAAANEHMLFTDADCMPASNQWLRLMQQQFTSGKEIVLGYSPYKRYGGLLNLYIRFETLLTAMFYFSFALNKNTLMGVGRNLAYQKGVFFRHKGFASHSHLLSGDDDLFVNQAATPTNVAIQINPDSFVYTEPKRDFTAYSRQKTRHLSVGKYYQKKHKRALGVYYASHFLFYAALVTLLVLDIHQWEMALGIYLLRLISQEVVFYLSAKKLKCTQVLWFLPILDILFVFYMLNFGTKGLLSKESKQHW